MRNDSVVGTAVVGHTGGGTVRSFV